ncbi:MAG: P-loop NTPase [Acidimicrobiia bacterium]|nr:P-loop NTPase [Acidimicrobiia bacterium]
MPTSDTGFDAHLAPLDVAVVDRDRLWRVGIMNALRPLYVEMYEDAADMSDRVHRGDATVVVVGRERGSATFDDLAELRARCPAVGVVVLADEPIEDAPVDRWLPVEATEADVVEAVTAFLRDREELAVEGAQSPLVGYGADGPALVLVTSAKGGVGRSTVAMNLAVAWATEHGSRVALVESDPYFGDLMAMAGIQPPPAWQELRGSSASNLALVERCRFVIEPSGVVLVVPPLPADVWSTPDDAVLTEAVASVGDDEVDAVVVDVAPHLLGRGTLVEAADIAYVVVPTDATGLKNGYLLAVALHRRFGGVTPVEFVFVDRDGHAEMSAASQGPTTIPVAASVPHDRRVPAAGKKHRPVVETHPRTGAGRALRALAERTVARVGRTR